uniref:Uncharacterized protein n=1 Tax=Crocodylus porosus TaxID=8502 RepID=A0A7M4FC48_CROPO
MIKPPGWPEGPATNEPVSIARKHNLPCWPLMDMRQNNFLKKLTYHTS